MESIKCVESQEGGSHQILYYENKLKELNNIILIFIIMAKNIIENKIIFIILFVALLGGVQPVLLQYILKNNVQRKYILIYIAFFNLIFYYIYFTYIDKGHPDEIKLIENPEENPSHLAIFCLMLVYTIVCITIPNLIYVNTVDPNSIIKYNALLYISPFFTLMIAYMLYNEKLTQKSIIGAGLIVAGCVFIAK